ncbi:potassium-transporting ATPase subunit KdpA [Salmonella enterica subsp. enterica]|nr:potassium-transporting ATPase subunit KdpA [Salmonella enterica subsp. enterica]
MLFPVALITALFYPTRRTVKPVGLSAHHQFLEGAKQPFDGAGCFAGGDQMLWQRRGFFNANSSHPFENPTALATRDAAIF